MHVEKHKDKIPAGKNHLNEPFHIYLDESDGLYTIHDNGETYYELVKIYPLFLSAEFEYKISKKDVSFEKNVVSRTFNSIDDLNTEARKLSEVLNSLYGEIKKRSRTNKD